MDSLSVQFGLKMLNLNPKNTIYFNKIVTNVIGYLNSTVNSVVVSSIKLYFNYNLNKTSKFSTSFFF